MLQVDQLYALISESIPAPSPGAAVSVIMPAAGTEQFNEDGVRHVPIKGTVRVRLKVFCGACPGVMAEGFPVFRRAQT